MNLFHAVVVMLAFLVGYSFVFAMTRAEVDGAGLADKYVGALMVFRLLACLAVLIAVLVAAHSLFQMALFLAGAALLFGTSELLLRYYRTNAKTGRDTRPG